MKRPAALALATAALLACHKDDRGDRPQGAPAAEDESRREQREAQAQGEATPRASRQRRAAERATAVRKVAGTVEHATPYRVTIRAPGEPALGLRVAAGTKVTLDGRPTRAEALKEGTAVRAAYQTGGGAAATALSIEASSQARPPPPAEWAPNTGEPGSPGGG